MSNERHLLRAHRAANTVAMNSPQHSNEALLADAVHNLVAAVAEQPASREERKPAALSGAFAYIALAAILKKNPDIEVTQDEILDAHSENPSLDAYYDASRQLWHIRRRAPDRD